MLSLLLRVQKFSFPLKSPPPTFLFIYIKFYGNEILGRGLLGYYSVQSGR
jgi:hypothetical protein